MRGRMIHYWPSRIPQSKIKTESSGVKTPYVVSQLRTIWESIYRFISLYPDSQAIFKPYLTTHIFAILFVQCLCELRNFLSIFLLFLNTSPPPLLLEIFLKLPSIFKVIKWGCRWGQDIILVTFVPFVFLLYANTLKSNNRHQEKEN